MKKQKVVGNLSFYIRDYYFEKFLKCIKLSEYSKKKNVQKPKDGKSTIYKK